MAQTLHAVQAAATGPSPLWWTVLGSILGSGVISAVITSIVTGRRSLGEARRKGCAEAIEALVAWGEYPYRIRRRASDDTETMAALAVIGHEIQERKARTLAWVAGENTQLYEVFLANSEYLDRKVGPTIAAAWQEPPITTAAGMVLSGWGPGRCAAETAKRLNCAVSYHCGRRWRGLRWISPLYRRRLGRFLPPELSASPPTPDTGS